jgi:uncharacterized DUF497 family protein
VPHQALCRPEVWVSRCRIIIDGTRSALASIHGVTFEEAATTWLDPLAIERVDSAHSQAEPRWLRIGASLRGQLLVVWSSERQARGRTVIRLIGARRATATERRRQAWQGAEHGDTLGAHHEHTA